MASVLILVAQVIVGINFLLSCYLTFLSHGLGWAIVAFFVVPIGMVGAPFFVGTWPFFLLGVGIFVIGNFLRSREEKKFNRQLLDHVISRSGRISDKATSAEVIGTARATPLFATDEIKGNGKLFGQPDGTLFWVGDNGVTFEMGDGIERWGSSSWESRKDSPDLFFKLNFGLGSDFVITEPEKARWIEWFRNHHSDKEQ